MLAKNVGGIDRILRIVVGAALLLGFVMTMGAPYSWLYLIGIVPLATGLTQRCALYSLIGVNTCPMKK